MTGITHTTFKVMAATLLNRSDFLLQKLRSYGEALNLMDPYFCRLWWKVTLR